MIPEPREPKVLIYDLENSPESGWYWGRRYDTNIIRKIDDWYILSYAYKWYGEPNSKIKFVRKAARKGDDKSLMKSLWKLYDEADAVLAHNGDAFDQKKAWTRMSYHDLGPTSSYVEIDTLKLLRTKFKHTSNKLDDIAEYYGIGRKLPTGGFDTWLGCMANDEKAWKLMEKYNKRDVVLLDGVYDRIKPYVRTKLNQQHWAGLGVCPQCGSDDMVRWGFRYTAAAKKQEYRCNTCGARSAALLADDGRLRQ